MEDLDHDQDKTDELVKSADPSKSYMDGKGLCGKCHGPKRKCTRAGCPN